MSSIRVASCIISATALASASMISGCGGPNVDAGPASTLSIAPVPVEPEERALDGGNRESRAQVQAEEGSGDADPGRCPWNLDTMAASAVDADYLLPPIPEARMNWQVMDTPRGSFSLSATFRLRDDGGLQQGTEHYFCDSAGLHLSVVETTVRRVRFEPALLVLPSTHGTGEAHGRIVFTENDTEEIFAYSFSWVTQPLGLADELGLHGFGAMRVASVLDTASERYARRWSTLTDWLTSDSLVLPHRRVQTVAIDDDDAQREERLDGVTVNGQRLF